ncbi:MAG TPA: NUDIX hydrolase [Terriglobales bacterium]|nr:NUDIX hydrolase [Reyranella sp.]HYD50053.1 NUDIX hydrolase [Terriglobales bacterium]
MKIERKGPWQVVAGRTVYDNPWLEVTHYEVVTPAGSTGIYGKIHYKHLAVGIVPIDAERHTYLVGQYRFPLEAYSWEIPEGGGTPGIDPVESAARELKEETGLVAAQWQKVAEADLSNSTSDERAIAFVAWQLTAGTAMPEPTEDITVRRVPLEEAFQMVAAGEIRDSLSVIALQAVQLAVLRARLGSNPPAWLVK